MGGHLLHAQLQDLSLSKQEAVHQSKKIEEVAANQQSGETESIDLDSSDEEISFPNGSQATYVWRRRWPFF